VQLEANLPRLQRPSLLKKTFIDTFITMPPEDRIKAVVRFAWQMKCLALLHTVGIALNVYGGFYWMASFFIGPVCAFMGARKLSPKLLDG
jgi:hypothetical protein